MSLLWVDKYRPSGLENLRHGDGGGTAEALKKLVSDTTDLPHVLLTGPPGSGKKTLTRAFLSELFGASASKIKIEEKVFKTPSGRRLEIPLYSSNYHIEFCPADAGIFDRVAIQEIIQELAQSQQVDKTKQPFKIAVIFEADRLTKDAQHSLRRTMEKFSANMRLVLISTSASRIIGPIRSRCLLLRTPVLGDVDAKRFLTKIAQAEGASVPEQQIEHILKESSGNLRKSALLLEGFAKNGRLEPLDWESSINEICNLIVQTRSSASLLQIRGILYSLLSHCIPSAIIIKKLMVDLLRSENDKSFAFKCIEAGAIYERRAFSGSKPILHLEAFVAQIISVLASQRSVKN